jgi:hypothetical protein
MTVIHGAVEGLLDEAVLKRLIAHVGAEPGPIHVKHGKANLRNGIQGYNAAARFAPWAVLVDLNHEAECAPPLVNDWLPSPRQRIRLRIAVREVEAWLLADRARLARFLGVARSRIPQTPDNLDDPKQTMVNLGRGSRRRALREDMVPRPRSGIAQGPAYTSRLTEFVNDRAKGWRPEVAAHGSDSLDRCIRSLRGLADQSA